jgi:glycosyltransferase involved in cell wall biosynthesis
MRLLFVTQKLHGQDVFGTLWARAFVERGYEVTVLCLESRPDLIDATLGITPGSSFRIVSMGKEEGLGKVRQILRFWKHIVTLRYDRVFIHMSPVWGLLGAWWWWPRRIPTYLWYTHYKMQLGLRLLGWYGKRLFCATPQSLPQYKNNPKKIVTGHGIDTHFWPKRQNTTNNQYALLGVYRLSRSKRVELCLHALKLLRPIFTWDVYGIEAEPGYVAEMKELTESLGLTNRVRFHGTAAAKDLPEIYSNHRLILNMALETIDKTMLEAMTCGCYPVTTGRNCIAIGIPFGPLDDSPKSIASFVEQASEHAPLSADQMFDVVSGNHNLASLVKKMDVYIHAGI